MPPVDGHRLTAFATNAPRTGPGSQLADLELRHRRRARREDRIRNAKDTGLTNLPLHGFNANQIWCEIVALTADLIAWLQLLGCTDPDDQTAHQARRNRNASGCDCSRPPAGLPSAPAAVTCTSLRAVAGPASFWPSSPDSAPCPNPAADPRATTLTPASRTTSDGPEPTPSGIGATVRPLSQNQRSARATTSRSSVSPGPRKLRARRTQAVYRP